MPKNFSSEGKKVNKNLFLLSFLLNVQDFLIAVDGDKFKERFSYFTSVKNPSISVTRWIMLQKKGFLSSSSEDIIFNFRDKFLTASGIALLEGNEFFLKMDGLWACLNNPKERNLKRKIIFGKVINDDKTWWDYSNVWRGLKIMKKQWLLKLKLGGS